MKMENIKRILEQNKIDFLDIEYHETNFAHHFTVILSRPIITYYDIKCILKYFPNNFENIFFDEDTKTLALSLHFLKKDIEHDLDSL